MATMHRAYRFRLRPTAVQEQLLLQHAGMYRYVYNWALATRQEHYKETGKSLSSYDMFRRLSVLAKEPDTVWLQGAAMHALRESVKDLDRAYKNFFARRSRFPRFKSRHRTQPSIRHPQGVRVQDGRVKCPKIGWIRIRQSQDVIGKIKLATFKRDARNHWYVSIVTEFESPDAVIVARPDRVIGVDLGLTDFIVTSEGERVSAPKHLRRAERKLRKANKALSRTKKGSKNREKARRRLAIVHGKVANQRKDFLHKLSTRLVNEHDAVILEDLSVKGLARTKLAKSVMDAAWGEFARQVEYKSQWSCKPFVKIDRFFPSSKTCNVCGSINDGLTLADRVWTCGCGAVIDRDLNAARNIRDQGLLSLVAAGHAETQNACGDAVRRAA